MDTKGEEEGVDHIKIEKKIVEDRGFRFYDINTHDGNQMLRFLMRKLVSINEFYFMVDRHTRREPISICVPQTRFIKNVELLIVANMKYFPELVTVKEELLLNACAFINGSHVALGFGFTNPATEEMQRFTIYLCPYDLIYHDKTRAFFLSMAAMAYAKQRFGITTYDKQNVITAIYEEKCFKHLERTNLAELNDQVNNQGLKVYAAFNDAITTLPFIGMYEMFRRALLVPKRKDDERALTDDQLYNFRVRELMQHKYYSPKVYKDVLPMDLDYCPTCLRLDDPE